MDYDISVVLGSKNRKNLLKATINSIRKNGFHGNLEIIVIDGGSTDGTCSWLAKQKDIFTMIQPNYKMTDSEGIRVLAHSWGEFMNIAFKYASAPYIVMVSDDLILHEGCLQNGYDELERRRINGEKIGAGAFYFREFPRHAADGDVIMRLNECGWKSVALENCFSEHLCHKPKLRNRGVLSPSNERDMNTFRKRYPFEKTKNYFIKYTNQTISKKPFYLYAFANVFYGYLLRIVDKYRNADK